MTAVLEKFEKISGTDKYIGKGSRHDILGYADCYA